MNRRGFLAALAAVPALPMAAKAERAPASAVGMVRGQEFVIHASRGWLGPAGLSVSSDKIGKLPKRAVVGKVLDRERLLIAYSDEPCDHIEMYDGHAPLGHDRDYSTKAELLAATGKPGFYATCLSEGLARPFGSFNGRPAYEWGAIIR